jgi:hypothetical protein
MQLKGADSYTLIKGSFLACEVHVAHICAGTDWAHPRHICAGTDWAHPGHICAGTRSVPASCSTSRFCLSA